MSKDTEKLAVLFADICGSTALYSTRGDELARRLIASCIETMTSAATAHQGTLIKTIGDEILCTFPTAEAAFQAACAMQSAVQNSRYEGGNRLHIRIGFHYGEVICEANDVFGDTVNVAARISAAARANHIMTSQAAVDALPPHLKMKACPIMQAEFKGKEDECAVFIVMLEEEDDGGTRIHVPQSSKPKENNTSELTLSYRGNLFKVNKERKSLLVGRDNSCDLVVPSNFASRQHARFEFRFGKFMIVDQSTNGTYIRLIDGTITHITREEMILSNSGTISLAQSYADNPTELIEFSINKNQ